MNREKMVFRLSKRGAIELSVSFIISLLIAIVVFGFGLRLGYKLIFQAEELSDKVSKDTEAKLLSVLTSGTKVAIPEGIKKLKPGQSQAFGIGIYNIMSDPGQYFSISVMPEKFYRNEREDGADFAALESGKIVDTKGKTWVIIPRPQIVSPNEKKIISVPLQVPDGTTKGTYVFNVKVCYTSVCDTDDFLYGDKHQVMVSVI